MSDLINASFCLINLPFTVLLIFIILYWLATMLGVLDIEFFDAMFDFDVEGSEGFLGFTIGLINIGEIPIMIVVSITAISIWSLSVLLNYHFNKKLSLLIALALLVLNLITSFIITVFAIKPLRKFFKIFNNKKDTKKSAVFSIGHVTTTKVSSSFGQVEIPAKGAPILINARTTGDLVLKKGDQVIVFDENKEKGYFLVDRFNE